MVLVDYIGISFYMRQYFWPHTVHFTFPRQNNNQALDVQYVTKHLPRGH